MLKKSVFYRLSRLLFFSFLLQGCYADLYLPWLSTGMSSSNPLPEKALYLFADSDNFPDNMYPNALYIINAESWEVYKEVPLLSGRRPSSLQRDPMGRLWIGYGGGVGYIDDRVQIYTADGTLLRTLRPCADPYLDILFSVEVAFISCAQNGFSARFVTIDLETLETVADTELSIEGGLFLLSSVGGDSQLVLAWGGGEQTNRLAIYDIQTSELKSILPAPDMYPTEILAYQGKFYLLNAVSRTYIPEENLDVLIFDPADPEISQELKLPVRSPIRGDIHEGQLYSVHDSYWYAGENDSSRYVTRLDLETGESEIWPLPDNWRVYDIAWFEGRVLLTPALGRDSEQISGIYALDPQTGELTQLMHIPGVSRILVPLP